MIKNRLQLALDRLQPSDWQRFERFASAFLAADFDDLRTTAAPAGDDGRDSELFSADSDPSVVFQYSVAADWSAKIKRTARRLNDTRPATQVLVYLTNQVVGAAADSLKRTIRKEHNLALDVWDQHWFLERVLGSTPREKAAEELAQAIVDPLLAAAGVAPHVPTELSSPEAIAALTFLGLQWRDDIRDKGLTKLAFEALVRAALIDTNSENRRPRPAVHEAVLRLLPGHSEDQVRGYVESALRRLTKRALRHYQKADEFCLSYEETQRLSDFRAQRALDETALAASIHGLALTLLQERGLADTHARLLGTRIRTVTEAVLLQRSQAFAVAVQTGSVAGMAGSDYDDILLADLGHTPLPKVPNTDWLAILRDGVRDILTSEDPSVLAHLRSLADSYTLLAFLRQTPDVQGAVEKMFSHGEIWLDASVVLPLIAEPLSEEESGRFTRMIDAAADAGLDLFITPGVAEEVERHMNRALTCVRMVHGRWQGRIPYLLERYVASGRSPAAFPSWLETFRGDTRPIEDISEYLEDSFGIKTRGLEAERDAAPADLRHALELLWHEAHQRRRQRFGDQTDDMIVNRLVGHDVECYCGVTTLRTREKTSPFGFSAWWLTIDHQAFGLAPRLRQAMSGPPPESPVLSADFLVNYLAFGPVRRRLSKSKEAHLPLIMDLGPARYLTPDILAEAEAVRDGLKDVPERVVRRRVRDHLDRARWRIGPIAEAGLRELDDELVA